MTFTVRCKRRENLHVVMVTGDVDVATAPAVRTQFNRCIAQGATFLIADLTQMSFCDSQGVNALVATHKHIAEYGGELRLVIPSLHNFHRVLLICGLMNTFSVYEDLADALVTE